MRASDNGDRNFKSASMAAFIDNHPRAAFVAFCVLHIAIWTLLPSVLYPNLPLDLIEARTYGPEWQLGYDKLPPLPWWAIEVMYRAFGADWSYYLLGADRRSLRLLRSSGPPRCRWSAPPARSQV